MRILIVDDEKLTRDGLIASINWQALSFDQIDQADDGMNALKIARKTPPDILLTDVRMPRMNGIELVEKMQEINPNCSVIFMSGYSDKEYLMAAIKLRAVRYVEKPIDSKEITEALVESINTLLLNKAQEKSLQYFTKEATSKLAQRLIKNGFDLKRDTSIDDANLQIRINVSTVFTTCIIKIYPILTQMIEDNLSSNLKAFDDQIAKWHLNEIHFVKNETYLVIHLFGSDRPSEAILRKIGTHIKSILPVDLKYFIAIGKTVSGPGKVYHSYNSAVILLQSSFFFDYGSILVYQNTEETIPGSYPHEFLQEFSDMIREKNPQKAHELAESLYMTLKYNRTQLANIIKDLYYKLFMLINSVQYDLKLQTENLASDSESLLSTISDCRILKELHDMLLNKIDEFEGKLQTSVQENTTIFIIRDYISKHYGDYSLSIKDISEHVHLSSSYLCTVFKTETGGTLNQYITDYRIDKAKQLLKDPRNKIIEISTRVGYSDCNYFGKIFKKVVGLTPSEYREKELV